MNKLTYITTSLATVIVVSIFRFELIKFGPTDIDVDVPSSIISHEEGAELGWVTGCSNKVARAYRQTTDVVYEPDRVDDTANMFCQCYWDHMRDKGGLEINEFRDGDSSDPTSRVSIAYSEAQSACYEQHKDNYYLW